MIEIILIVFIILLIFANIKSINRLIKSYFFIKKYNNIKYLNENKEIINIIIPVYKEVNNIEKSVKYFKNLNSICNVYYITTSKESNGETYNKLKEVIEKYNTDNIFVYNSPNRKGTMANQLNYGAKKIDSNSIIGIYNIDSFPDARTFKYVEENIKSNIVLQQVSYFDDKREGILKCAQNWQNRWSIIYEMGKYLNNHKFNFVYTIGHGLFLRKNILDKCGYWSEEEINEDNEFGYRLICNNIKIKPIPFLEKSDFAKSLKIYIKQQSTWVNGPMYAFSYYRKGHGIKKLILASLNFKAFISWWLFPVVFITLFTISIFINIYFSVIIMLLTFSYITIINYMVHKMLMQKNYIKTNICFFNFNDFCFFIVHCFGAFITVCKIINKKSPAGGLPSISLIDIC